ncbi:MAG: cadherin-like beta sandwich domain-containing protein [Lachnospiraceae bacterium]|nr:cadherin-like beta sandwich domain-containing protein [Lachnospiraceae bacterium]
MEKRQNQQVLKAAALLLAAALTFLCLPSSTRAEVPTAHYQSSYSGKAGTVEKIHEYFPESYWEGLEALLAEHPKWRFKAFYTGLTWNELFDGSFTLYSPAGESEMTLRRNLLQWIRDKDSPYYNKTSWLSTSIEGAYNWSKSEWEILSAPDWVQASEEAVRYCMDPRNWLDERQIFQFEDMTAYMATVREVEKVFENVSSDFWVQDAEDTGITSSYGLEEDEDEVPLTYAQAVYEIGRRLKINPVILASRIVQEQGTGYTDDASSGNVRSLISGKAKFTVTKGEDEGKKVKGGYFNYFNVEATDGDEADYTRIVNNGLTEAYYAGWDTRYAALYGGAEKLKASFIDNDQNTFYFQKFMVNSESYYCMWHQYMQSLTTPQYEASKAYNSYVNGNDRGRLNAYHLFVIPVYLGMPEAPEPEPTKDGDPNYKIGSIYVNGSSLKDFDTDQLKYSMIVDFSVTEVTFNIHPYSENAVVTVGTLNKEKIPGDLTGKQNLMLGDNVFKIMCKAENGDKRTYKLTIHRDGDVTYGDINADGKFNSLDLAYMTSHLLQKHVLEGSALDAADISGDGKVNSLDLAYLTSYLLGKIDQLPR